MLLIHALDLCCITFESHLVLVHVTFIKRAQIRLPPDVPEERSEAHHRLARSLVLQQDYK